MHKGPIIFLSFSELTVLIWSPQMIGCDSDECPYEWFHLSCVGLSKPLPQTWYCEDCRERMEREKSEKPAKKRKR